MSLMNAFRHNTTGFVKTALLATGLAFAGGMTETANAQGFTKHKDKENKVRNYAGYFGVSRVSSAALNNYDPYQTGTVLTVQGEAPFSDKAESPLRHFGLLGKYEYYLADPNQITGSWHYTQWNRQGQTSFSHVPSRATVGVFAHTPYKYRVGAKAFVGATAYPGSRMNWLNSAHLSTSLEVCARMFSPKSQVNIELFANANHIVYNQNWWSNRWRPEDKKSTSYINFGARVALFSGPE